MESRKFAKSFEDVLTQAYLFHTGLVRDKSEFIAYSPLFADPYAEDFLDLINDAAELPTNDEDLNYQVVHSLEVEDKMVEARDLYQELMSYLKLKWPDSEATTRIFGSNLYEKARKNPLRMVDLLEMANRGAESVKYKTDLIALGFTQADITSLLTIAGEITDCGISNRIIFSWLRTGRRNA